MAKVIETKDEHEAALKRIEKLMDASPETCDDELQTLVSLVEEYEAIHFPIDAPNPLDALRRI